MSPLEILVLHSVPGDGACNEDKVGATSHAAWVIDGATGLGGSLLDHTTDAAWFVEALDAALRDGLERRPEVPTPDILYEAVTAVGQRFENERLAEPTAPHELPSAAFAMARLIDGALELTALGDCSIVYGGQGQDPFLFSADGVGRFEAETLAELTELYANDPGLEVDEAKKLILPRLRRNRMQMNTEDGYWILGLDPRAIDRLERRLIEPGLGTVEIALASDGFMRLEALLGLVTPGEILAARTDAAAEALIKRLRDAEMEDARCRTYIRAKRSDDASFVRARCTI